MERVCQGAQTRAVSFHRHQSIRGCSNFSYQLCDYPLSME
uniref:Uncharacterized protein n=1 Tax=Arundo donax TaxID=35708 RepID=A0A0A9ACU1_ARUDO